MNYVKLAAVLIGIVASLIRWRQKVGDISAEDNAVLAKLTAGVLNDLAKIKASDDAVRAWLAQHPGNMPSLDPNRRD